MSCFVNKSDLTDCLFACVYVPSDINRHESQMYAISIGHIYLLVGQWKMSFSVDFIQLLLVTFRGNLNGTKECLTVPEVSLLQKRL